MLRSQAISLGLKKYWPTQPCAKGHDAMREVKGPCSECAKIAKRNWRATNPEIAARSSASAWAKANPERHSANSKRWIQANMWYATKSTNDRRARKLNAEGTFTKDDIVRLFDSQGGKCKQCDSTERLEVDHIIPLAKGGSNWPSKLQILCRSCNAKKGCGLLG